MSFYNTPTTAASPFIQTIGYVTSAISVTAGYNALAYSPVTIAPGGSITVPSTSSLTIKIPC
jgi:hypothetical protein